MLDLTFDQYCNAPAFPVDQVDFESMDNKFVYRAVGITRLEYFTAKAMEGLLRAGFDDEYVSGFAKNTATHVLEVLFKRL